MTYDEAMEELASAVADAYIAALKAVEAADNEDGAPVDALRKMRAALKNIADDADCLSDHRCTRAEFRDMESLYNGAKLAGLTP